MLCARDFSAQVNKYFVILQVNVLAHSWWSDTFWYPVVHNSFLVPFHSAFQQAVTQTASTHLRIRTAAIISWLHQTAGGPIRTLGRAIRANNIIRRWFVNIPHSHWIPRYGMCILGATSCWYVTCV